MLSWLIPDPLGVIELTEARIRAMQEWEASEPPESGVVRVYRDTGRERQALFAQREKIAQQMAWRARSTKINYR